MLAVHVKWNPALPRQEQLAKRSRLFQQQIGLKFKAGTCEMLHFEHRVLWCWNWYTSEIGSELPLKLWNVVLECRMKRRSAGPTDRVTNEVLHGVRNERDILHTTQRRQANSIGHILRTNHHIIHLFERKKKRWNWREDEENDVSSYWIFLQKRGDTGVRKKGSSSYFKDNVLWKRFIYEGGPNNNRNLNVARETK
jgi:hypothetical protein